MVDGPATEAVRSAIVGHGPIGFDRYLSLALYGSDGGFFTRGRGAGRTGRDFLTSPEVGPLFSLVVGRALDAWWDQLGRPEPYIVIDAGAGPGTLARGVLAAGLRCRDALDLVLVEVSDEQRAGHPDGARSLDSYRGGPITGVVLANELLDNLAFRLLEKTEHGWAEVVVDIADGGDLVARIGPPLADHEVAWCPDAPVGSRIPDQYEARSWVREHLDLIDRGRLVVIDYASTTADLAARPVDEWLRTYRDQHRGTAVLDAPGSQDVTVEVCLDQLPGGPEVVSQARFLRTHGLDELVAEGRRVWSERAHIGDLAALMARSRINEAEALTDPSGLGSFSVAVWDRPVQCSP